jgi:isoaspartyl peptidase/L-asparaginase-like protein (Ntn-hydrolase superfamily)
MSAALMNAKKTLRAAIHALHEAQEAVAVLEDRVAWSAGHDAIVDAYRCFDRVLELLPGELRETE